MEAPSVMPQIANNTRNLVRAHSLLPLQQPQMLLAGLASGWDSSSRMIWSEPLADPAAATAASDRLADFAREEGDPMTDFAE